MCTLVALVKIAAISMKPPSQITIGNAEALLSYLYTQGGRGPLIAKIEIAFAEFARQKLLMKQFLKTTQPTRRNLIKKTLDDPHWVRRLTPIWGSNYSQWLMIQLGKEFVHCIESNNKN